MTLQSATSSETQSGFLLQTGKSVTGSLLLSGQTISGQPDCAGVGSALGQMDGSGLSMTVSPAGQTVSLTGAAANNFTSLTGNYSILASGCGQTETGTWTANRVNPLSGAFQATFTSSFTSGLVFAFTGTISQGTNTGGSTATLSGTMTSSNSPCFSSASVTGVITGTSVVLNLATADGISLGKYSGTLATDATSMTGSYRFSNASNPDILAGCGGGDGGDATFSVQASPSM
jgi:hypothetical protein